ncbi:MAG: enoyl-CoA hydratase/isomerase family protein [Planctomycetes bacterium]|nr:enoyl-CoA hydratase/isomerase family protein [Planctomycetota bacterium]
MPIHLDNKVHRGVPFSSVTIEHGPHNILDLDHCRELTSALQEIRADDRSRVVVLRGHGKCFSSGVDIKQHTREEMPELLPAFHEIFAELLKLRAFTIAAVHGHCLGGAAELALACDRVVAESSASIGLPEVTLGCYPPVAIPLLPERLPTGMAVGMLISGQPANTEELCRHGAVDRVVTGGQLQAGVEAELDLFAQKSPAILGMIADLVHDEARRRWGERIPHMETQYLEKLLPHPDVEEGIAAFLEKREPRWQDPDERPDPREALDWKTN